MVTQLSQLSHPRIHAGLHERATTPLCTETPCLGLLWIPLGEEQRDWPSEPAQWPAILYAGWSLPGYHWEPSEKGTTKKQYNYSFWFTYIPILDWVPPSVYAVGTNYLSIYMAIKWTAALLWDARPLICTLEFHLAKLLVKLPGTNSQSVHSA